MILTAERNLVQGGSWHNVQIACAYGAHRPFEHDISIEVAGGTWSGDDPDWQPVYDLNPRRPKVYIHHNRFDLRSPEPMRGAYAFRCANPNHRFENNEIFIAATAHRGDGDDLVGQFEDAFVQANHWLTDLKPPLRFRNFYGGSVVIGERFTGSFGAL